MCGGGGLIILPALFAIGVPAQIIILMSYGIIQNPVKKLKKQEKTEDTNQEIDK